MVFRYSFICSIFLTVIFTQVAQESSPRSFLFDQTSEIPIIAMEEIDVERLLEEDETEREKPYRFGYGIDVEISMNNSGVWTILEDGSKIWQLQIESPGAYSLNIIYDQYHLPSGAEFFLYTLDRSMVLGAFTDFNHKPHGGFSTSPVEGDVSILEYNEPADAEFTGHIQLESIIHGYKDVFFHPERGYGDSGSCNNNVMCSEGDAWESDIRSVAMILTAGGSRLCTGALVNNVRQDLSPLFLTANHCLGGNNSWIFMFNYQSPGCANQDGPTNMTVSGSSLLANHSTSDFALLELNENPPENYNVHYAGWSAIDIAPQQPVAIHHPSGDIKKISFDYDAGISDGWSNNDGSHWRIADWEDGTTEPGSSGSPIFDSNHHLVGQLHGGQASCSFNVNDYYGKVSSSWNLGLSNHLDPDNTGTTTLDGTDAVDLPDPALDYTADDLEFLLFEGESDIASINISNTGEAESVLMYSMSASPFGITGAGSDNFGYVWTDSGINVHQNYEWIDISGMGSLYSFPHNDQAGGSVAIGFDFPYYGQTYSQCIINPNGWVGFGADNDEWDNVTIPGSSAPNPAVLAFWDDLNPINDNCNTSCSGNVFTYSDGEKFVIWFNDVAHWASADYENAAYDFQVVLYSDGVIDVNYNTITGNYSPTIGIQNSGGSDGHQVYMANLATSGEWPSGSKSLSFATAPAWLGLNSIGNSSASGEIFAGNSATVDVVAENAGLAEDTYSAYVTLSSNAGTPVSFEVTLETSGSAVLPGDVNQDGSIDVLDIVNTINIILDPESATPLEFQAADVNDDDAVNVLDVVLIVNIILES